MNWDSEPVIRLNTQRHLTVHMEGNGQDIDKKTLKDTTKDALSVIESFGRGEYMESLGLNYSTFRYFFRDVL